MGCAREKERGLGSLGLSVHLFSSGSFVTVICLLGQVLFCFSYSEIKPVLNVFNDQRCQASDTLLASFTCGSGTYFCASVCGLRWIESLMEPGGDFSTWRSRCCAPSGLLCGETTLFYCRNSSGLLSDGSCADSRHLPGAQPCFVCTLLPTSVAALHDSASSCKATK